MSHAGAGQRVVRGIILALVVWGLVIVAGCRKGKPEKPVSPLDKIPIKEAVVLVGDTKVSGAWLRNWCATQELQFLRGGMPVQVDEYSLINAGRQILTKIVLIAGEAERRGLTVSDQAIQDQLSKEMKLFPSTEAWRDRMTASGMTVEDRKEQIRLELLFNKYREEVVTPEVIKTRANPETAREYYDRFPQQFQRPRSVHLAHIMRSVAKDAPADQREKERANIEKARARVSSGEKFEDVAREVSTDVSAIKGGDIKWVNEQTPIGPEIKSKVLVLKPGEMTEIIESPAGFHIFQALEVQEAGVVPFEEAQEGIQKQLLEKALQVSMERAAADLQKQTTVQFLDLTPYIGKPPEKAAGAPAIGAPVPPPGAAAPPAAPAAPAAPARH
jgi:parvulin-like peptidyl-prolyl isomerase